MDEKGRKELRLFYEKEYHMKTGYKLDCIEQNGIRPARQKEACRNNILDIVAAHTGISVHNILRKSRSPKVVEIRRMICTIMKDYKVGTEEIGNLLYLDHSTVVYSQQTNANYCATDEEYRERYNSMKKYCRERISEIHAATKKPPMSQATIEQIKVDYKEYKDYKIVAKMHNVFWGTVEKIVHNRYKRKKIQ